MKDIGELLQIVLITYNRAANLQETLTALMDESSPVRDFDITILDNASTDGTHEVVRRFQVRHENLKYVRRRRNVGGNANIAHAFEIADKEYLWVLCDDDTYCWAGWKELEDYIRAGSDVVCVANYLLNDRTRDLPEYQLNQMTFLPSIVLCTRLLTSSCMRNIYDCIYAMFPHLAPIVSFLNAGGKINVLNKGLVSSGQKQGADSSYLRGTPDDEIFNRNRTMTWKVGYANLVANIRKRDLARRCFRVTNDGDTPSRMGYLHFYLETFRRFRGAENRMQIVDLQMQSGPVVCFVLFLIRIVQESFLYWPIVRLRDFCQSMMSK